MQLRKNLLTLKKKKKAKNTGAERLFFFFFVFLLHFTRQNMLQVSATSIAGMGVFLTERILQYRLVRFINYNS